MRARLFAFGLMAFLAAAALYTHYDNDAVAAIFQSSSLTQPSNLQQGLVGWWTFDGKDLTTTTVTDRSGQGNAGTLLRAPTPVPGRIGQALRFKSPNDQISAGTPASLNNIQQLTVTFWGKGAAGQAVTKAAWSIDPTSGIYFQRNFSGGNAIWTTAGGQNQNEWHQYVMTYDDSSTSNNPIFYIDGIASTTVTLLAPSGSASSDASFALLLPYTGFDGALDDVRVYNRILSAAEVKQLYLMGGGVKRKSVAGSGPVPTPVTLDSGGASGVGQYTSIARGADGYPVISYYDVTNHDLKFVKCNDAACSVPIVRTLDSPSDVGQYSSIAVGRDGFPVISYSDVSLDQVKFAKCNDASCASVATSTLFSNVGIPRYTSIAIGSDGFPVISWYNNGNFDLRFVKCDDISCSSFTQRTIDSNYPTQQLGPYSSVAIGADGLPIMSYQNQTAAAPGVRFAKCNDPSCASVSTTTLDNFSSTSFFTSLAVGKDGFPIVAYYDAGTAVVKIGKCNDMACRNAATSTLDSSAAAFSYPSIKIGTDGYPVIAYRDSANGRLKLAKCSNSSCSRSTQLTLDSAGNVGQYTSIAIGTDGFPVISYYDVTNKALKFLHCNAYCGSITTIGKSQESVTPGGLVGYWSFNGKNTHWLTNTTDDLSGQGNTGTMVNMSMSTSPTAGRIGQGLRFVNGDDPSVSVVQTSSINDLTNKTITAWIKPTSLGQSNHGTIVGKYSSPNGWMLRLESVLSQPRLDFYQSFSGNDGEWDCSTSLAYGDWQFVAVTYNNSATGNTPTFNINGATCSGTLVSPATGSADSDSSINLSIGNITGNTLDFDGVIDEVRVYNRILSAADINTLYNAGR